MTANAYRVDRVAQITPPLRITMLGIRGFPNIQGGAENHAQYLSAGLIELGCHVEVIVRSPYVAKDSVRTFARVKLVRLWSPRIKGVEALVHTFCGVMRCSLTRPDILHIHSVGPALFTPLARAFGLTVVVTHHLANWESHKWGPLGRTILRLGEKAGMVFANGRIAVSKTLARRIESIYRVTVFTIPNGIPRPRKVRSTAQLTAFGLQPNRYALMVARIDEQKRQLELIEAFKRTQPSGWKLAMVGSADYSSEYARAVALAASRTAGVVMLGQQTGDILAELYTYAGVFVMPSSHEGQPIAVLEAISYGCPTILSDIPPHREIAASNTELIPVDDTAALARRLDARFCTITERRPDAGDQARFLDDHDWHKIAQRTADVYLAALSQHLE
jgi:glycosyltransferase involved in cell wall biosynthesis